MKTIFAPIALFVAGALAQNSFTINTPSNVVECEPTLITWSGGTAPYYLSILPGASPNGAAIESFPATNSTSDSWTVNIASGTSIGLTLRDSTGSVAQSAPFTVNAGSSSSCLNSTSVSPGPTEASTSAAATGGVTASTTTGASPTGTTAASSGSSTPSATSTSSSSGASANVAQFGVAGVVGAAVAALFL